MILTGENGSGIPDGALSFSGKTNPNFSNFSSMIAITYSELTFIGFSHNLDKCISIDIAT